MSRDSEDRVDLSRRGFLTGRLGRARPLGPPPPCIAGADLDSCFVCQTKPCAATCEPGVIRIHSQGHPLAGRAYLSFDRAGCTFCGDCYDACPSATAPRSEPPTAIGLAVLSRAECIAWNGVICISCSTACSWQAVTVGAKGRPAISDQACTGCGMCVAVCPTQAISISD